MFEYFIGLKMGYIGQFFYPSYIDINLLYVFWGFGLHFPKRLTIICFVGFSMSDTYFAYLPYNNTALLGIFATYHKEIWYNLVIYIIFD